jgi:ATP-dependent DNA helicase DinG
MAHSPPKRTLDIKKALHIIQSGGLLSHSLKGFDPRAAQQAMMRNVIEAYNEEQIALIEAGTGTGKSMAYLIPAILWAHEHKECTLISTNTIALQEQLIRKDIPLIAKALNLSVKAVLVKGMSNYVCLRKMEETRHERLLLNPEEAEEFAKIEAWESNSSDGSRASLRFTPSPAVWERLSAESDTCNGAHCPYYQECRFFQARRQATDAHILVVNHHLLFADLACRAEENNYENNAILPTYHRIILDEAHNIEEIATEHFAKKVSQLGLMRTLVKVSSDREGKLLVLKRKFEEILYQGHHDKLVPLYQRLTIDLPGMRQEVIERIVGSFHTFAEFVFHLKAGPERSIEDLPQGEHKLRLLPCHQNEARWDQEVLPQTKRLIDVLERYAISLHHLEYNLKELSNDQFQEQTKAIRHDLVALGTRFKDAAEVLKHFIAADPQTIVRWIAVHVKNVQLVAAELDIAKRLATFLFSKFSTIILCSATLTANRRFDFFRQRLGLLAELLPERTITEQSYDSPFDYQKQALFLVPSDIPDPLDSRFLPAAIESIWEAIQASDGNAFVLFTSYSMLRECHKQLTARLVSAKFTALKQGDDNRSALLHKFKTIDHSVLFGTDSFWEGVDVVGEALRCVIIVKLPFKVPSEPIIQARTEKILAEGGNPFLEYSLPHAIVKFKQGIGRLIRNKKDRGCIVCLDSRLLNKGYGSQFLDSLPPYEKRIVESSSLRKQMQEFYRKTYHLAKP